MEFGSRHHLAPRILTWLLDFLKKLFTPDVRCKVSRRQQHRTLCNKHDPDSGQSPVFLWYTMKAVRELSAQTVISRRQL